MKGMTEDYETQTIVWHSAVATEL